MQGGRSVVDSRRALLEIRAGAVRALEAAAAWIVVTADVDVKLSLADQVWTFARAGEAIRRRLPGLRCPDEWTERPPIRSAVAVRAVVDTVAPADRLGFLASASTVLARRAASARADTDTATDEGTATALDDFARLLDVPIAEHDAHRGLSELLDVEAGEADGSVPPIPALPAVPLRPARDATCPLDENYAFGSMRTDLSNLGEFLHSIAMGVELCATEACAAMLAHDVDAPWGLRLDLARQTKDEARHFRLLSRRARELGVPLGSFPAEFAIWDRFRLGRSLAERLMIEQRIGETAGLDGGADLEARLRAAGDLVTADLFDFVNADEVTHVHTANRWLPALLDGVPVEVFEQRTRDWVLSSGRVTLPSPPAPSVELRRLAGYRETDPRPDGS